jgi:hypothetical protein
MISGKSQGTTGYVGSGVGMQPRPCSASELQIEQRGGRGACEVDGEVPHVARYVLGHHKVPIEYTDEGVASKILQAGVSNQLMLTFFPG